MGEEIEQPIFLAILLEATGGKQDQVLNTASVRELESVLEDAQAFLADMLLKREAWLDVIKSFSSSLRYVRTASPP